MVDSNELTHVDAEGRARMVDVAEKAETRRVARARAVVRMRPETLAAIRDGAVAKGAVLPVARTAGIMGGKRTAELIPMCHPLRVTSIRVDFAYPSDTELEVTSEVCAVDRTGVEMEALCACTTAALTVYDMCKAIDRAMTVADVELTYKVGGKSGEWVR